MQRFKNILLLLDDELTGQGFERAISLARKNQARLTVAAALEWVPREMQMLVPAVGPADLMELAGKERLAELEGLVRPKREGGIAIRTRVLCGRPFQEVIREVVCEGHDLVMMMAEEGGDFGQSLFGSTSMHLMRKCPCPVWVMTPSQPEKYNRVLAAVDPIATDETHQALNIKIMELAISMAQTDGAELHVVHAWTPFPKAALRLGGLSDEEEARVVGAYAAIPEKAFCELLRRFQMEESRVQTHLIAGKAGEIIPALARDKAVDLIVMGTVCRTGVAGLLIGNTAERILRRVGCSVLTVKPEGFVTPVSCTDRRLSWGGSESGDTLEE